ncbi:MAG: sel1 repeat family protein [Deltaproteobacteria bacterium]|jgi:TPR repeat protein|nr:sel1 repeat family protein [Deltaproteobacteria bacterium]
MNWTREMNGTGEMSDLNGRDDLDKLDGLDLLDLRTDAEQGDRESQYLLGLACRSGRLTGVDLEEAARWWQEAAEQGHSESVRQLAGLLEEGGEGLPADPALSFYWWLQAARSGEGEAQAPICCKVGRAYLEGRGVVRDEGQAVRWLEKSAALGSDAARETLAGLRSAGAEG